MNPAPATDERIQPASGPASHRRALPSGTRLREYEITGVIGEAGFGIVYTAWDDSLRRKVVVKEYLPGALASRVAGSVEIEPSSAHYHDVYKAGLKGFIAEARLLARFDHASLVKVYRFWEENGTAYTVMPFYEGPTLGAALAELDHVPSETELRAWLKPILNAVALLHDGEAWHQNIGPDNIVLTPIGPVLFGMGAARHAIAELQHAPGTALKPGFAAIEQYGHAAGTSRGPWTDLYALAAVIYAAITGAAPAAAADRLADDPVRPLSLVAAGLYSERFLAAIDAALAVEPQRRPRDHRQFRALMGDLDAPEPVELAPQRDLMHEPFAGRADEPREITVPDRPLLSLGEPPAKAAGKAATPGASTRPAPLAAAPTTRIGLDGAPAPAAEPTPSWMRSAAAVQRFLDKRVVYGVVAGGCALVGIAALALQFQARQAAQPVAAPAVAKQPAIASMPAVALSPSSVAAPALPALPPRPAPAAVTTVATAERVAEAASNPAFARPPGAASATAPTEDLRAPANEGERLVRCTEILQKASLEQITAGETNFYKRECK